MPQDATAPAQGNGPVDQDERSDSERDSDDDSVNSMEAPDITEVMDNVVNQTRFNSAFQFLQNNRTHCPIVISTEGEEAFYEWYYEHVYLPYAGY